MRNGQCVLMEVGVRQAMRAWPEATNLISSMPLNAAQPSTPSAPLEVNLVSAGLDEFFLGSLPLFVSTLSVCEDIFFFFCTWKGSSHYSWVLWQGIMQPREHTKKVLLKPSALWTSIGCKAMWGRGGPNHIVLLYLQSVQPSQLRPFLLCFLLMRIMWLRG